MPKQHCRTSLWKPVPKWRWKIRICQPIGKDQSQMRCPSLSKASSFQYISFSKEAGNEKRLCLFHPETRQEARNLATRQYTGNSSCIGMSRTTNFISHPAILLNWYADIFISRRKASIEMFCYKQRFYLYRRPLGTYGIETSFLFPACMVPQHHREHWSVRSSTPLCRNVWEFVTEYPDKASCKTWDSSSTCPKVTKSAPPLIVHGMHKLCRHKHLISVGKACHTCKIGRIMMRIKSVEISPGMDDMPTLNLSYLQSCHYRYFHPPSFPLLHR